jgi:Leucine-rich repeat (LRR) protein
MFLLYASIALIAPYSIGCKPSKSGVFDNVTVLIKGLDKTTTEDSILIEFDDSLSKYLNNKPSEIVIIRNQFIPKLETNSVADLTKVQNLTLASNGIREIQQGTFQNLPNLKVLNLSRNSIEEVRIGIFTDLVMHDLYLDHNKISRIGYKAFSKLHLKNLFLRNNRISRWSKDWFADSSVLVLDMGYNLIEELPPNAFHLMSKPANNSMSVIFTGNQVKKLNSHVFSGVSTYDRIVLDGNSMDRLAPGVFDGVRRVNVLNLNNNSLSEVNADVLGTVQIDVLMLEDNKLRCLSTDIFRMEELDIDGNPISCFCVKTWLDWRDRHSNPSIYHITNLEEECI